MDTQMNRLWIINLNIRFVQTSDRIRAIQSRKWYACVSINVLKGHILLTKFALWWHYISKTLDQHHMCYFFQVISYISILECGMLLILPP